MGNQATNAQMAILTAAAQAATLTATASPTQANINIAAICQQAYFAGIYNNGSAFCANTIDDLHDAEFDTNWYYEATVACPGIWPALQALCQ